MLHQNRERPCSLRNRPGTDEKFSIKYQDADEHGGDARAEKIALVVEDPIDGAARKLGPRKASEDRQNETNGKAEKDRAIVEAEANTGMHRRVWILGNRSGAGDSDPCRDDKTERQHGKKSKYRSHVVNVPRT